MEFTLPQVPTQLSKTETKYLSACLTVQRPIDVDLEQLMENSSTFPRKILVSAVTCNTLLTYDYVNKKILEENANCCYPLLHENALLLYVNFLKHKRRYGNAVEAVVYDNLGVLDLVQRLLEKRAACFLGPVDHWYLLVSGESGAGGWEKVGTEIEENPLYLRDCLSYDEIKLSALLSVSSPTYFINDGRRNNNGIPNKHPDSFTTHGVITGLIGTCFERLESMDCQDILVTKEQNVKMNGYGPPPRIKFVPNKHERVVLQSLRQLWADFYGVEPHLPLYDEAVKLHKACRKDTSPQYVELSKGILFDNKIYKKRVSVSIETYLIEAESRAAAINKKAYVHMVGLGLGVWLLSAHQELEFLEAFANCLRRLRPNLQHISDINFSWFRETFQMPMWEDIMTPNEKGPGINIIFSKRDPHEKLSEADADKLLVVSFAWDANALPGNEFWLGSLSASGDPAAASSTQIAELFNPHINKGKANGANLHIASRQWGVLHVSEYIKRQWPNLESTAAE